jgi:hypothetical protein
MAFMSFIKTRCLLVYILFELSVAHVLLELAIEDQMLFDSHA